MDTEAKFTRDFVIPINAGREENATVAQRKTMMKKLSLLHDMTDNYVQRCVRAACCVLAWCRAAG